MRRLYSKESEPGEPGFLQKSKDPGPEDPALVHRRGVEFTLESQWNNGMVE